MAQGILPFQYEVEKRDGGMTAMAGLPLYLEFAHAMGLPRLIADHIQARQSDQGWTDEQMIMALILLNLAGGDCVDDLRVLEGDEGFCRVLRELEFYGRTRSEKRALARRWRKQRTLTLPSPTSVRDYLELFHEPREEKLRKEHEAFVPEPSKLLTALSRLNGAFAACVLSPIGCVTKSTVQCIAIWRFESP